MEDEMTLDLGKVIEIFKKSKLIIIGITVIFTIITATLVFFVIKPTYEATSSVVVKTNSDSKDIRANDELQAAINSQKLVKTYAQIGISRTVLQKVIDNLNLDLNTKELKEKIELTPAVDTQMFNISVKDSSPYAAYKIANEFDKVFLNECKTKYNIGQLEILDTPILPIKPIKHNKKLDVALGFMIGFMFSIGIVFLKEYMNKTLQSEEDVEKYLDLPVIGIIPKIK